MAAIRLPRCEVCGRELKDPDSILKGFGPDCADKRAAFYAGGGLSVEAVDALATTEVADVHRWLTSMKRALRAGNCEVARIFFENASKAQRAATQATATLAA